MNSKLSTFFDRLDQHVGPLPLDVLRSAMNDLNITLDDLKGFVSYDGECYQRNRLHIGPGYHALALCWSPGQHSVIHNHEGSGCGFLVVNGTATETLYTVGDDGMLQQHETRTHQPGTVRVSFDADIHRMGNENVRDGLVTLHIYSPPLLEAETYELGSQRRGRWVDPITEKVSSSR